MKDMTAEYEKFTTLHALFVEDSAGARSQLQQMFPVDSEGAVKLMLFWAASCLNFGSSCRTKAPKKFDPVLVKGWDTGDKYKKYFDRLGRMGVLHNGGYEGNDSELLYVKVEGDCVGRAEKNTYVFLPLFKVWFEEAVEFANRVYPSGIMAAAMQSIHTRAKGGQILIKPQETLAQLLGDSRPERVSVTTRIKTADRTPTDYSGLIYEGLKADREKVMEELRSLGPSPIFRKHDDIMDACANMKNHSINKGTKTMSKTSDFMNSVKGIFGDVLRMQRGRAMVHAAKRVIFKAFPIQWGILSRVTGKAKKFEDHALTDVAVALVLHGAANALLDDPKKRATYLQYTEEMVAAAVANAGFKMVPVEEILDKVLNGALDSEAVAKLKSALGDKAE